MKYKLITQRNIKIQLEQGCVKDTQPGTFERQERHVKDMAMQKDM